MASLTQKLKDVNNRFKGVRTEHINKLIDINKTLLKNNGETTSNTNIPSECKLILESGGTLLQILNQQMMDKSGERVDLFNPGGQVLGIISPILEGVGNTHLVLAGVSMIGHLLTKVGDMAENRNECLELLRYMVDVAFRIKMLKPHVRNEEKQLEKAFLIIVKGSMLCAKQLRSKHFFRFLRSSLDKNNLSSLKLEIDRLKHDLQLIAQTAILRQQPGRVPTTQPNYPSDAAGIEEPIRQVNIKLRMDPKDESFRAVSFRAVAIYGVGGIGKTYLGNAVYSKLNLKGYNYSSVIMDIDPQKNNIKRMQEQILFDLFPGYNNGREINLSDPEQGRKELKSAFKKENKPVFLFIDNVLRAQDLKDLLPKGLERLGKHIRLLLTARELSSTDMFDEEFRREYCVEPLDEKDARKILCKEKKNLDRIKGDVDKILKICGGFPLVLKIVGLHLKNQGYKAEKCSQILNALQKGKEIKESALSECMVDFVFKGFEESTQEAFLDICCFFNGDRRQAVEYVVGSMEFKALEDAALIKVKVEREYYAPMQKDDEVVVVHDVIKAKGQNMARSSRITDIESFEEAVQEKRLQEIKGIALYCDKQHPSYVLRNEHLNSMRKSLRVLTLGTNISVSAKSDMRFPELRNIYLSDIFPCVPFNPAALKNLAVYRGPLPKHDSISKLPQSLRKITLYKSTELKSQSKPVQMDLNSSLEDLSVVSLSMKRLPMKLESFSALKTLRLVKCYEMEELAEVIRGLRSLTSLILVGCPLKHLPQILNPLTHLDLEDCDKLRDCEKVGDLKTLQFLSLKGCTSVKKLPSTFGKLKDLRYLNLRRCSSLEEVPGFQRLVGLKYFNVQSCPKLRGKFSNRPKDLRFEG